MVSATISLGSSNRPSTLARFSLHRVAWSVLECARPTRALQFSLSFCSGVAEATLYCAYRMSTVSSCAFCEQEGHLAAPSHPSETARCTSTGAPATQIHTFPPSTNLKGVARLPFTPRIEGPSSFCMILQSSLASLSRNGTRVGPTAAVGQGYRWSLQARLLSLRGWRLIDLPLRASNDGFLRPRVARAQEINRLHPLLCSGSKGSAWVSFHPFHRGPSASKKDGLATPDLTS
jgi:hypothetical protein